MCSMTIRQKLLLLPFAALTGCGGDLALPTPSGEGIALLIVDGDDQTGRVGEELPLPLVVSVESGGDPIPDSRVAFSIVAAPPGVRVEPDTAFTGEDGRAAAHVVLGTETGAYEIEARLVVAESQPPPTAVFVGSAVAGAPDTLRAASPLIQPGRRGEPVPDSPTVVVLDRFGNPVAGAGVQWEVTAGGGQVSGGATADAQGRATATWTLGDGVGVQKLMAQVEGAHGSPITFTAGVLF
jgi:hypothetical protein